MLLIEIIEPRATKEKIPVEKRALGAGAVAKVYPHETDPHMVVKKEKSHKDKRSLDRFGIHSRNDGFAYYVDAASPYMQSNPYLPRVYIKNTRQAKNGIVSYTYVIERLVDRFDSNSVTPELIDAIAEKILVDPYFVVRATKFEKWSKLTDYIDQAIRTNNYSTIKDKKLIEAGNIVHEAISKFKNDWPQSDATIRIDLHSGNFMIRMTPVGPQLVITDPLYSH
ncbi:hypothetical protein UFOVP257_264 [uncultured Caudovirales phage]|uniref:Uncharacterized protein n=1 Tax=uncultured Caudovirales phage TaxID=2100421 RepID=A0A6J5LJ05_9CAUD|nr:hypothetical protein UFOVP257_264 [uncultured Caudovirales phage]